MIRNSISLTSPDGDSFQAKWVGNDRTMARKVATIVYPGVDGVKTQDHGAGGTLYPLAFYFEDDTVANQFFATCVVQRGLWGVIHPMRGALTLQLLTLKEKLFPVESVSYTGVDSEWMEVTLNENIASWSHYRQRDVIQSDIEALKAAVTTSFEDNIKQDTAQERRSIAEIVEGIVNSVKDNLASVYKPITQGNTFIFVAE